MKINHNFALIGALLFTLTTAGCGNDTQKEAERLYQENLDYVVSDLEFDKMDYSTPDWLTLITIPEKPVLDKWDKLYSQPQIMFHYGEDSTIYIMNMNGTDVRLLLHRDELGKLPAPTGFTQRSNTGRYLLLDYYAMAGTNCAVFDLENREIVSDTNACYGATFSQDDRYFYYMSYGSELYPHRVDLEKKVTTNVLPDEVEVGRDVFYPKARDSGSFFVDDANDRFVWSLSSDIARKQPDLPRTVVFRLSDMKLLGRQEYLPENCEGGHGYHMDKRYFVCGREYATYRMSDPMTLVENSPYDEMIQRGKWYMDSDGRDVYRYKQPGESGMFNKVKYIYKIKPKGSEDYADYKLPGKFSAYLPPNLVNDFDNMDLGVFFPVIPTQAQYQESYQRQLKERKETNNGK
ncbi:TolB-like translocation protein [Aliivibrio fischeri]|uniref:hypothetical protein n=1 Tax=Aliivibrio fischeri TaxID=668 RepID=UPI003735F218